MVEMTKGKLKIVGVVCEQNMAGKVGSRPAEEQ